MLPAHKSCWPARGSSWRRSSSRSCHHASGDIFSACHSRGRWRLTRSGPSTGARLDSQPMSTSATGAQADIKDSILDTVGETPLVRLSRIAAGVRPQIVAKLESFNPGGSIKDRVAMRLVEAAERDGRLRAGGTIIEPTPGNTGTGPVIAGPVVGVSGQIVDAPFPVGLALTVGFFDLIPQIGSEIAGFIVVMITLIGTGVVPALILLAVIIVYQQVENYLIQPAVMRQAVELSGFATIACVMLGGALLGVVGAILAVPVAASVKVIVREATEGRRQRIAAPRA